MWILENFKLYLCPVFLAHISFLLDTAALDWMLFISEHMLSHAFILLFLIFPLLETQSYSLFIFLPELLSLQIIFAYLYYSTYNKSYINMFVFPVNRHRDCVYFYPLFLPHMHNRHATNVAKLNCRIDFWDLCGNESEWYHFDVTKVKYQCTWTLQSYYL